MVRSGPTSFPVRCRCPRCGAGPRDLPQHRVRGRGGGLADQLRKAVGKELVGQKGLGKSYGYGYDILWYRLMIMVIVWLLMILMAMVMVIVGYYMINGSGYCMVINDIDDLWLWLWYGYDILWYFYIIMIFMVMILSHSYIFISLWYTMILIYSNSNIDD